MSEAAKNRAGHWMVVDLRRDSDTLRAMAKSYFYDEGKFPALFRLAEISHQLDLLAAQLADKAGTVEHLMVQLEGAVHE